MALSLLLAGCLGSGEPEVSRQQPASAAAGVHSPTDETLTLPSLRSGSGFYTDVRLRLGADGTWELLSATPGTDLGQHAVATLDPPRLLEGLSSSTEPSFLTIARLHQGSTLHDDARIRLQGDRWAFAESLTPAVALAGHDFAANPDLAANASHVVTLHTGPTIGRQRFPVDLNKGSYRLCADAGNGGTDRMTLFDAQGTARATVSSGEACRSVIVPPGRYVVEHEFLGGDSHRHVFFGHRSGGAAPLSAHASRPMAAPAPLNLGSDEYWAFGPANLDYLLALGDSTIGGYPGPACNSFGFPTPFFYHPFAWRDRAFFRVARDDAGTVIGLAEPMVCPSVGYDFAQGLVQTLPDESWEGTGFLPISLNPDDGSFTLSLAGQALAVMYGQPGAQEMLKSAVDDSGSPTPPTVFKRRFRYFPVGINPSALTPGQVALWPSSDTCSGQQALVTEGTNMASLFADIGQNWFPSIHLGPHTTAIVYDQENYQGSSQHVASTDCVSIPFATRARSMQLITETVDLVLSADGCPQCNLSGLNFAAAAEASGQECNLRNFNLTSANLSRAVLTGCDLSGAKLQGAILQGTILNRANLGGAWMCNALLNAASTGVGAQLVGASLRDVNLSGGNLNGANFSFASFYSEKLQKPAGCPKDCSGSGSAASSCASAYAATANGTIFSNAYLAGLNLASSSARGAKFHKAVLFGASLDNADLRAGPSGAATDFSNAYLQGADFTSSQAAGATFSSAYTDLFDAVITNAYSVDLTSEQTLFTGFRTPNAKGECVPTAQLPSGESINRVASHIYAQTTVRPATDASNVCPNASMPAAGSSCSDEAWKQPITPLTGATPKAWTFRPALPPFPNKCGYSPTL